jgi:hypothetical protein
MVITRQLPLELHTNRATLHSDEGLFVTSSGSRVVVCIAITIRLISPTFDNKFRSYISLESGGIRPRI